MKQATTNVSTEPPAPPSPQLGSLSLSLSLTLEDEDKSARDGVLERLDPPLAVGGVHSPRELVGGVKPGLV